MRRFVSSSLRLAALPVVGLAILVSTAACGSGGSAAAGSGSGAVDVVAATNVWGNIAATIGGDQVNVTSIISDPSADPHSFEANPRTQLAVAKADVLIENGGGYDDFMDRMRSSSKTKAAVINAVDVSGKQATAAGGDVNEHVWYDFPTVKKVADSIEAALSKADPGHAADFAANNTTFQGRLDALISSENQDKTAVAGAGVAITEPVPVYLLDAVGAQNKTPSEFSHAIEEGSDVSPAVLQQTLDLFTTHAVKALVYNEQTAGNETEQVLNAARSNGVAVVPVTETLPKGEDYLSWMQQNLDAVDHALTSST
jgi:zinc/manganese transport system substrate-binding protein